ncbi:NAD(P)-dependent oxidoreductase [Adhaeribacter arboris]|uniref:NAD(P)-dependent oxidoreductase n=1 Tax=Adhaeribacter arboris TaxID=2072846 RepID=A0A2T2YBP9_9BACT|nr:SDR family oxidoreductase [Adhaeribacter arboris]PSR52951.1 NAD(P)-dependent oxidoreductase [Adhaeribacter arboris]
MNNTWNRVSILGCGWLGLPLAERLVSSGYQVKGSTTSPEKLELLRQKNIQPFLINLSANPDALYLADFLKADCLIISFPPRLRAGGEALYLPQIQLLTSALRQSSVKKVLFISSTSVYREVNGTVKENDPAVILKESPLYQAENLMQNSSGYKTIILRFGGLVGGNRHPGRFLAGKTEVPQPEAPVNLIHLEDCLQLCAKLIQNPTPHHEVYNAVTDKHPSRNEFYTAVAKNLGLTPPQFAATETPQFKIISNEKLKVALAYEFIYPDPMFFF